MFARAYIGSEGSSVITQGMSDAVLLASPLERRLLIEEAAGVKQYRIEKERAVKKLGATIENISRTDALRAEIEPHLKHLGREAEKLSKIRGVSDALQQKQLRKFSFLWSKNLLERKEFLEDEQRASDHLRVASQELEKRQAELQVILKSVGDDTERERNLLEQEEARLRNQIFSEERDKSLILGKIDSEEYRRKPREVVESVPVDRAFVQAKIDEIRHHQEKLLDRLAHVESMDEMQEIRELARVVMTRLSDLRSVSDSESVVTKRLVALSPEETVKSDERLSAFQAELEKVSARIGEISKKHDALKEKLESERLATEENRRRFFRLEQLVHEKQRDLERAKDRMNDLRIRLARADVRRDDLEKEITEELHREARSLPVFDMASDTIDLNREEREILRLKVELEQSGSIDPLVAAEFEETKKRYSFLESESEDLRRAVESLRKVISEAEERIRTEFESAWSEVNREFGRYFRIIFGGGSASLAKIPVHRLSHSLAKNLDDVAEEQGSGGEGTALEIGIDIAVSPPGKRISNLSMLSGGERSLVALALLFAVISHNPPPFAVLDEVEAALDEANSKRFGDLLSELSKRTQFIAITHNRETMRKAAILYGITMGDDGVSKVLSLRLEDVKIGGK